ncbi:MAG: hypothetical protein KF822_12170 [Steroidobacteraceae bacterium]|nr:hypothetical protein [Steroidobacteraceae bacterium]
MPADTDEAKLLRVTRQALGWLLIGAACGLAGCKTTDVPTFSVYDALPGKWGRQYDKELGCDGNPRVISFSEDRKQMTVTYAKPWKSVVGETDTVRYSAGTGSTGDPACAPGQSSDARPTDNRSVQCGRCSRRRRSGKSRMSIIFDMM